MLLAIGNFNETIANSKYMFALANSKVLQMDV